MAIHKLGKSKLIYYGQGSNPRQILAFRKIRKQFIAVNKAMD